MEDAAGVPIGTSKTVQDRKAFPRVDPAERLLMTGEEMMAGTRAKRLRASSQTHMDIEHHVRAERANGAHRYTMRSEAHSHAQEMLTDEEENDEPKKGETTAEIHFYREDTPPSVAKLGLPSSDDQTSDYTSVSATVIRKHSQKGPAVTPDQPSAEQKDQQKLSAIHDKSDVEKMVVQDDTIMQPMDESEGSKPVEPPPRTTSQKNSVTPGSCDTDMPQADQRQSKEKDSLSTKSALSKSLKGTDHEKSSAQNGAFEVSKRMQSILPPEEEWESTYDPDQPLEERLTATVIRRHVKPKSAAKQQTDSKQESSGPTDSSSADVMQSDASSSVQTPSKDKTFSVQGMPLSKNGVVTPEVQLALTVDNMGKEPHHSYSQKSEDSVQVVVKQDSKDATQRITKEDLVTSSACDIAKDIKSSAKKPAQSSVGVKDIVVSVSSDAAQSIQERNSITIESAVQGSTKQPKKDMTLVRYNAGSKSPSPGKRVSIREPSETVVREDSEISAQRTSKSGASKTSPSGKDVESDETSRQQQAGESEIESGSWVEEGRDAATKAEVNGLANPRNSKSCCFCWCCCCSCSCLSVNNNIRRSRDSKQQPPQQSGNMDHYFNGDGEPQPTLEDIRTWGESFDKLMKCGAGRKVFREFLQCEYSEENILFWLACEDLKKETNPDVIEEKAKLIYEDFISILSPREVSLDSRVRDIINKNMVQPTPNTFDEAQLQIYTLMHRDSYPRFVNSPIYRKLAQLPVPSRKGSMA